MKFHRKVSILSTLIVISLPLLSPNALSYNVDMNYYFIYKQLITYKLKFVLMLNYQANFKCIKLLIDYIYKKIQYVNNIDNKFNYFLIIK